MWIFSVSIIVYLTPELFWGAYETLNDFNSMPLIYGSETPYDNKSFENTSNIHFNILEIYPKIQEHVYSK